MGKTIVISSHILSEISAVCDHIMIISKGRLVADGSPRELEEMMQGKAKLEVTVLAEQEQVQAVLTQMKEVESFTAESGKEDGSILLRITAKGNIDIRKELSVALASAGLPILSMRQSEKSLEDIFLELTGKADESEEAADDDSNL